MSRVPARTLLLQVAGQLPGANGNRNPHSRELRRTKILGGEEEVKRILVAALRSISKGRYGLYLHDLLCHDVNRHVFVGSLAGLLFSTETFTPCLERRHLEWGEIITSCRGPGKPCADTVFES